MTPDEKLKALKTLLDISDDSEDALLETYLKLAQAEILAWRYSDREDMPYEVPVEYDVIQIHAVIAGYSIAGAENQTSHNENGISRAFKHSDMVAYIHDSIIPLAKVL